MGYRPKYNRRVLVIMDVIVKYIDELLERSTPEAPMWNIEKIKQGLKSNWNYIDGCMIKAVLEMYSISKDKKYLDLQMHLLIIVYMMMEQLKDMILMRRI